MQSNTKDHLLYDSENRPVCGVGRREWRVTADGLEGFFFSFSLLILEGGGERTGEREKRQFVAAMIYVFIGWFSYVP